MLGSDSTSVVTPTVGPSESKRSFQPVTNNFNTLKLLPFYLCAIGCYVSRQSRHESMTSKTVFGPKTCRHHVSNDGKLVLLSASIVIHSYLMHCECESCLRVHTSLLWKLQACAGSEVANCCGNGSIRNIRSTRTES